MRQLVDTESRERAYRLTNRADDLAAFNRARDNVQAPVARLGAVLREEGRGGDADRLRAQVATTLASFERIVDRVRVGAPIDGPCCDILKTKRGPER